jgi:SDR family mycofactocin-dependent oxidoreductase
VTRNYRHRMSGSLDGKVCLVTGAARGQGRNHARRLAAEGAAIVAFDLCAAATTVGYEPASEADLDETVGLVEDAGGRIHPRIGDVRDQASLDAAVADAVEHFGRLDVVVANAGVSCWGRFWELDDAVFEDVIAINLTGVWRTFKAAIPTMIEQGTGGSLIAISSVAGIKALPAQAHYASSKHGVVGLVKAAALELGPHRIRANSIHPWGVETHMVHDRSMGAVYRGHPEYQKSLGQVLPEPQFADPDDISDAVLYLAGDASRCMTGVQLPVDMGATIV